MTENEGDKIIPTLEASVEGSRWSVATILITVCVTVMVICGFASWVFVEMIRSR